jgi:predicted Zn-dependent protease
LVDGAAARRDGIRQRIMDAGSRTYLGETLVQTDSVLRRWPNDRISRPLKVLITRRDVRGFREDFVANVAWAVSRWNGVVPVGITTVGELDQADIVVTWVATLDSNRTGRTDLTWDRRGNIHRADIVLATHTPEGQLLDARRMSALALHEIGHAFGLGHSRSRHDALYPIAMSHALSERDRLTAQLLYDLPSGSLR